MGLGCFAGFCVSEAEVLGLGEGFAWNVIMAFVHGEGVRGWQYMSASCHLWMTRMDGSDIGHGIMSNAVTTPIK